MKNIRYFFIVLSAIFLVPKPEVIAESDSGNGKVEKVLVLFKTHLDIGFTDLSSAVEQRYIDEFIPKAIAVADELRSSGSGERYVWTTGAWLIDAYLRNASPERVEVLEKAISRGDIVWNGVPYTVESESLTKDMYEELMMLSARLDRKYSKKTIAAKMTDVPGHTRGIVPVLAGAGIRMLHVGVNSAVANPDVPSPCIWKSPDGSEIILVYQSSYGEDMILPGGRTVVSINFTNDNHGPHTVADVRRIYSELHARYPGASIVAASFNEVAEELEKVRDELPVLTSEIGDTWIYGYGSAPLRMAEYRALSRLFSEWLDSGKLSRGSDAATDFAVRLGMIAEHTWGLDVKSHLGNWDKYDFDIFTSSLALPEFMKMEKSWKELDDYIWQAVDILPGELQAEALDELEKIAGIPAKYADIDFRKSVKNRKIDENGRYDFAGMKLGELSYQTFSEADYEEFRKSYLTSDVYWAIADNGKPGLENSAASSASTDAELVGLAGKGQERICEVSFRKDERIDSRVYPEHTVIGYERLSRNKVEMTVSLINKPKNRLTEAYWLSFVPEDIIKVVAEKTGQEVDLENVVAGGNRQMHGIDRYVDIYTSSGKFRITSPDAFLIAAGERDAINFSREKPELSKGVHFCLFNNLWGTNFSMWWGGSVSFRFTIEYRLE